VRASIARKSRVQSRSGWIWFYKKSHPLFSWRMRPLGAKCGLFSGLFWCLTLRQKKRLRTAPEKKNDTGNAENDPSFVQKRLRLSIGVDWREQQFHKISITNRLRQKNKQKNGILISSYLFAVPAVFATPELDIHQNYPPRPSSTSSLAVGGRGAAPHQNFAFSITNRFLPCT
jgi:hypothetical protein